MERWLLSESHLFDGAVARLRRGRSARSYKKLLKTMIKDGKPPTRAQLVAVYPSLVGWLESLPARSRYSLRSVRRRRRRVALEPRLRS